jgi:hypothetical protein
MRRAASISLKAPVMSVELVFCYICKRVKNEENGGNRFTLVTKIKRTSGILKDVNQVFIQLSHRRDGTYDHAAIGPSWSCTVSRQYFFLVLKGWWLTVDCQSFLGPDLTRTCPWEEVTQGRSRTQANIIGSINIRSRVSTIDGHSHPTHWANRTCQHQRLP